MSTAKKGLLPAAPRSRPNRAPSQPAPVNAGVGHEFWTTPRDPQHALAAEQYVTIPRGAVVQYMDLLGVNNHGDLVLWDEDMPVLPLDKLPLRRDGWVVSGHYVLKHNDHLITCHVSNLQSRNLGILVMCNGNGAQVFSRAQIEAQLYGITLRTKIHEDISRTLESMSRSQGSRYDNAPARGRI